MRAPGPVSLLLTACVSGSGIMLAFLGPTARYPWPTVHKGAFIVWICAMAIHVLACLPRLPRLLSLVCPGHGFRGDLFGRGRGQRTGAV
jgi:hypothetical protein